jgi:hypothetical protein
VAREAIYNERIEEIKSQKKKGLFLPAALIYWLTGKLLANAAPSCTSSVPAVLKHSDDVF